MFRLSVTVITALSIGFHWALLQCVAWVGMAIVYTSEDGSLASGLAKTFDGAHPCLLCEAVESGMKNEQQQERKSPISGVELAKLKLVFKLQAEVEPVISIPPVRATPRPDYAGEWPRANARKPLEIPPRAV